MDAIVSNEDQRLFAELDAVPVVDTQEGGKVRGLVRFHNGQLSVERDWFGRRFWIWLRGTEGEYDFTSNAPRLSEVIPRGLQADVGILHSPMLAGLFGV